MDSKVKSMEFRKLLGSDLEQVRIMDQASGFFVSQWIEDLSPCEESLHCYGIFTRRDELVGYLTGFDADGLDIIKNHPSYSIYSVLLSDVYVKESYRKIGVGTKMIKDFLCNEVLDSASVFLTFMYDELQSFYEKLGFIKVEDTDNVMVLKNLYKEFNKEEIIYLHKVLNEARYFANDVRYYLYEVEKERPLTEKEKKLWDRTHDVHVHTDHAGCLISDKAFRK